MKKILTILAATILFFSFFEKSSTFLPDVEKQYRIRENSFHSATIDIGKRHVFRWEIHETDWPHNYGLFNLYMDFKRTPEMTEKNLWENDFDLKIKIEAHAITKNNIKADRLITNFYFPTNEPMRNNSNLWVGWSDEQMEFPAGEIMRFPNEKLFIEVTIKEPDEILNKAAPNLRLVGDYDPAAIGYVIIFRYMNWIIFLFCLVSLIFLTFRALKAD